MSYLKGMSAVEKGNAADAERNAQELEKLIQELSAQKPQQASDWYFGYASRIFAVHLLDLRGSVLSVQGKHEEAFKMLNEAIENEKNLGYWEPPHYTRPVLESLGQAFIRAGKYKEAMDAFEKILKVRPNSGFGFLAIARTYAKADDKTKATQFYKEFLKSWQNADRDLPQIQEAEKWMK